MIHNNPHGDDAIFLELSKMAEDGPSRASWSSKTFPEVPPNDAAIQNRGCAFLWDSEKSRVGWERGTLQTCSLSQDREILLYQTRNLIYSENPEFESKS